LRQQFFRLRPFPQITAQHGIHKAGLRSEPQSPGDFNRLMNDGVIGDTVEPEHLVKTEAK